MSTPPNCNSTAAGGPSRPTFAIAIISLRVRAGDKRPPIGTFLQQPALMFAFKGRRAVFYSAAADCADRWCAQQETGPEDAG